MSDRRDMLGDRPFTFDRTIRLVLTAGLIWALIWLLGRLSDVLAPFAVALALAYLINPVVNLVQRLIRPRPVAVALTLILAAAVLIGLAWLIIPLIGHELSRMGTLIRQLVTDSELARQAAQRLPDDIWQALRDLAERPEVRELFSPDRLPGLIKEALNKLLPGVWGILNGALAVVAWLLGLTAVALYFVFLLLDYSSLAENWSRLIPPAYRAQTEAFAAEASGAVNRYFRAQALVAALVGVLFALGFSLIGLPMAILLGLFIGLLNMVPYLQLVGLIPAAVLALIRALESGGGFGSSLALTGLVFVVVQLIQDGFLVPRIMGQTMGLSPVIILLSLSVWGKLLGFLGLLMAIPLTCLLWAYYRRLVGHETEALPEAEAPPASQPPPSGES